MLQALTVGLYHFELTLYVVMGQRSEPFLPHGPLAENTDMFPTELSSWHVCQNPIAGSGAGVFPDPSAPLAYGR